MNRPGWRAALLACALFHGGLALAQFPGYTQTSRYSYNPMTGTAMQSQGYYNPYTGAGGRSFSAYNPYTGGAVGGMAYQNPYTGNPYAGYSYAGGGGSFKTYYNARNSYNPYTGNVRNSSVTAQR